MVPAIPPTGSPLVISPTPPSGTAFQSLFHHAAQIVTVCAAGEHSKAGEAMNDIAVFSNACLLVDTQGKIVFVGPEDVLMAQPWFDRTRVERVVDCTNQAIVPGLIDGHTHPVFAGDRVNEFALKLAGATYMDIHAAGGGIGYTVQHTRAATQADLLRDLTTRANRIVRSGTTFAEAKTGYGLDTETELKMLRVLHQHNQSNHPLKFSITYLGAHSVPKGQTAPSYTQEILDQQIPAIVNAVAKGEVHVDNIDVFYERGIFERTETTRILQRGKELGWTANFHGDELHPMNSGEVAAEVHAHCISHVEMVSENDMKLMARHNVFAVLLPTTAYVLRLTPPPARKMIEFGVPVALGSDFNPNAHCLSMVHTMNLACITLRMTMNEALVAATINAAASLKQETKRGSLEPGKDADFILINHPDWRHLIYEMVDPPIDGVFIKGTRCA